MLGLCSPKPGSKGHTGGSLTYPRGQSHSLLPRLGKNPANKLGYTSQEPGEYRVSQESAVNNASVQQRRTAASGRPLLTLLPAAKLLGLIKEVPSRGARGSLDLGWQREPLSPSMSRESI